MPASRPEFVSPKEIIEAITAVSDVSVLSIRKRE